MVARVTLQGRERLARLERSSGSAVTAMLERSRRRLDGQAKLLETLGYHNVLARGFALVRDADGRMVRRASGSDLGRASTSSSPTAMSGAHADARPRKPESEREDEARRRRQARDLL